MAALSGIWASTVPPLQTEVRRTSAITGAAAFRRDGAKKELTARSQLFLYAIIPTRKMKLNSKRFCLGNLIPFDFS